MPEQLKVELNACLADCVTFLVRVCHCTSDYIYWILNAS